MSLSFSSLQQALYLMHQTANYDIIEPLNIKAGDKLFFPDEAPEEVREASINSLSLSVAFGNELITRAFTESESEELKAELFGVIKDCVLHGAPNVPFEFGKEYTVLEVRKGTAKDPIHLDLVLVSEDDMPVCIYGGLMLYKGTTLNGESVSDLLDAYLDKQDEEA